MGAPITLVRQKAQPQGHVLPRVSAALAQFIAPIATSTKQGLQQQSKTFERFGGGKKKEKGSGQEPKQGEPSQTHSPEGEKIAPVIQLPVKNAARESGPAIPAGISQALLQLMNLFHEQRATLIRWIGSGVYQGAARLQKKNGRIRKGTVIDEKAE